jgi:2-polyprenyl-6-methoxyphenol hydroxylase-like FAD-dependent oxidoreductase
MDAEVIVVGAGPVGLLLANLLGRRGIKTTVVEKESQEHRGSRAIGVSPPSLKILRQIGLDEEFIQHGVKGVRVLFRGSRATLGALQIRRLPTRYPFLLALPQATTETLLENNLSQFPSVEVRRGWECRRVIDESDHVHVKIRATSNLLQESLCAKFACGCDGEKSVVRKSVGIQFCGGRGKPTFVMGDYVDRSPYGSDGVLWFTREGSIESFPLPENKRRWILQTPAFVKKPPADFLEEGIYRLSGVPLKLRDKLSESPFGVQHYLATRFFKGHVFLCGDAAHTMSPILGQGMNTGFADAEFLAFVLDQCLRNLPQDLNDLGEKYDYYRRVAAKEAIRRAEMSMFVGTIKGKFLSAFRSIILYVALHTRLPDQILPMFTMLSIPFRTLNEVFAVDPQLHLLSRGKIHA